MSQACFIIIVIVIVMNRLYRFRDDIRYQDQQFASDVRYADDNSAINDDTQFLGEGSQYVDADNRYEAADTHYVDTDNQYVDTRYEERPSLSEDRLGGASDGRYDQFGMKYDNEAMNPDLYDREILEEKERLRHDIQAIQARKTAINSQYDIPEERRTKTHKDKSYYRLSDDGFITDDELNVIHDDVFSEDAFANIQEDRYREYLEKLKNAHDKLRDTLESYSSHTKLEPNDGPQLFRDEDFGDQVGVDGLLGDSLSKYNDDKYAGLDDGYDTDRSEISLNDRYASNEGLPLGLDDRYDTDGDAGIETHYDSPLSLDTRYQSDDRALSLDDQYDHDMQPLSLDDQYDDQPLSLDDRYDAQPLSLDDRYDTQPLSLDDRYEDDRAPMSLNDLSYRTSDREYQ